MRTKQRNEVLKLTREIDGTVMVSTQRGKNITLPAGAREATARYFENEEATEAWIVGKFFAPAGSAVASKVMFVARALPDQRW